MKGFFVALGFLLLGLFAGAQNVAGDWYGALNVHGMQLHLVMHIQKAGAGYTATMDSPDQHATGIPVPKITFQNDSLFMDLSNLHASYKAKFVSETHHFKGTFTQMGQEFPLELSREKRAGTPPERPQEPKKPYPYVSEDVRFQNKKQNVILAGTLTLPKKSGNFPAVVLITGSGPQDRNEEIMGHKPFLVISDYLTRRGIAVLRYDDRGTAKSTGDFKTATTSDFATDAAAAFNYLLSRKEIDPKKIGLLGHSEGGEIAPMVAAKNKQVAFLVLLAGPGVNGGKILVRQQELIGKANGESEEKVRKNKLINEGAYDIIRKTKDSVRMREKLNAYFKKSLKKYPNVQKPAGMSVQKFLKIMEKTYSSPWMQEFIRYAPATALKKVTCPVLALDGSHDLQVDADQNLPAIKKALEMGGNTAVTTKKITGLNHLFQESKTGSPSEYQKIEQTFSPKALKIIGDWIAKTIIQ